MIPTKPSTKNQMASFILKPIENLMSYDAQKIWISTKRGQVVRFGQVDGQLEREHNIVIDLRRVAGCPMESVNAFEFKCSPLRS